MAYHRFSCQHKGKGQFCHRCKQAEVLEVMLENKEQYAPKNLVEGAAQKPWTFAEMATEAKRLRSTSRKEVEIEL
jgi:hypothetical protein